ncbi:winged helix-turn-helix transcriptional regulator [Streptomyces lunaelactis]|uniref:GntR family transcriptional regulator n=1 Tax=Streptomyces lunaelactis TaxID=1535768 RepID=UPI001584EC8A|nr:winged helix-turn-helix domain-containing protein [Streptomyces lunaelactis]NUL07657.1 winged helix-turn-helix transcriptional regulator [Streptomyces lunaelactis]
MALTERGGERDGTARQYEYQRVAEDLRSRIASREEQYRAGDLMPTHGALMARYGVSRVTVQRAVKALRSEGLIDAGGRGKGSRIIAADTVPQTLAQRVAVAFAAKHVSLDVWSLTTEKLSKIVAQQVEDIERGTAPPPESIRARVLLPSLDVDYPLPRLISDPADPGPLRRLRGLIRTYARQLEHSLLAAAEYQRVGTVLVEIRCVAALPLQKCYILNGSEALTSFYRVQRNEVRERADSMPMEIFDLKSGSEVFTWGPMAGAGAERDGVYFEELRLLFESCWSNVAEPMALDE